jgi:hypothetical protein
MCPLRMHRDDNHSTTLEGEKTHTSPQKEEDIMSNRHTLILTMLVLTLSGVANAGELITNPLIPDADEKGILQCIAFNVGQKTLSTITIEIVDFHAMALESKTCSNVSPNAGCVGGAVSTFAAFCRITFPGSANDIRGTLQLFTITGTPQTAIGAQ